MTAPTFEATDQYDLLSLVADETRPVGRTDVEAFLDACKRDALDHDGIVSVNRVRELLSDRDFEHHRYSSFWANFTGNDRPMRKATVEDIDPPWETCEGSPSGNNGRPYRLRRWVGTANEVQA